MAFVGRFSTLGSLVCCAALAVGCASAAEADVREEGVSSESDALALGGLTRQQSATVVDLIDDICGDSWCEGDNNFEFVDLVCSKLVHRCTLVFKIIPRDEVPGARPFYWRQCTTAGFTGFDSLVTTSSNGYQSLDPDYYTELSECISQREDTLPR